MNIQFTRKTTKKDKQTAGGQADEIDKRLPDRPMKWINRLPDRLAKWRVRLPEKPGKWESRSSAKIRQPDRP